jgi:hypothetical protein
MLGLAALRWMIFLPVPPVRHAALKPINLLEQLAFVVRQVCGRCLTMGSGGKQS